MPKERHTFTAASFIKAKIWMKPKCPSIDEKIKMWYIYTYIYILSTYVFTHMHTDTHIMEYYSARKKNKIICDNMDEENIMLIEISQVEKENT